MHKRCLRPSTQVPRVPADLDDQRRRFTLRCVMLATTYTTFAFGHSHMTNGRVMCSVI